MSKMELRGTVLVVSGKGRKIQIRPTDKAGAFVLSDLQDFSPLLVRVEEKPFLCHDIGKMTATVAASPFLRDNPSFIKDVLDDHAPVSIRRLIEKVRALPNPDKQSSRKLVA